MLFRISLSQITVAFEELPEDLGEDNNAILTLHKLGNDVTYKRLREGMAALQVRNNKLYFVNLRKKYRDGPAFHLKDILFGSSQPSFSPPSIVCKY